MINPYRSPESHTNTAKETRYASRLQAARAGMWRGAVMGAKWMTCILLVLSVLVWGFIAVVTVYQCFAGGVPLSYLIDRLQLLSLALMTALTIVWVVLVTSGVCALLGGAAAAITHRRQLECLEGEEQSQQPSAAEG